MDRVAPPPAGGGWAWDDVLESLRGLRWPAGRRVAGGPPGAHRSRTRGTSAELAEYRAYRQGDDVRRLDWKLLARTDRAYVRLAEDHAVLPMTVVVDASASMAYPVATWGKWVHAARVAVGLAALAHASGDPVGARVSGDGTLAPRLPPRMRRGVVRDIAAALAAVSPAGDAPLAPLLADLRGRVVIVSDFLGDADALLAAAHAAGARGCEVVAVHVVDGAELDPPRGDAVLADPEAPAVRRALIRRTRGAYLARFAAWRAAIALEWRASGALYLMTRSGAGGDSAAGAVRRLVRGGEPGGARGGETHATGEERAGAEPRPT